MSTGLQRLVRRAVLVLLKNDDYLKELVPTARWYGQSAPADPAWPFGKLGASTSQRFRATGVNGAQVAFAIHAFARAREVAGQVVETAEDHAGRIGEHVERVLSDNRFELTEGPVVKLWLSDMQLMQDGGPDAFHWFAQVNARVLAQTLPAC